MSLLVNAVVVLRSGAAVERAELVAAGLFLLACAAVIQGFAAHRRRALFEYGPQITPPTVGMLALAGITLLCSLGALLVMGATRR